MSKDIRCTIEILADEKFNIYDANGERLQILHPKEVKSAIEGKTIKFAEVTPLSTYLELNSGAIFINGVWINLP